ncbi:MAG: hypothetical protein Q4G14_02050 [Paracoccus sp. (in: a-proteobacteria)]|uniref:hypothetical protein n=1 Tax=Paracoccus sp. TaxID=267 RepID=UPI0026DF315C|nr:hypothetical protein [Paracoccus sp. (in: a-proteobacteria)]MDO5612009.1 hypothetical protein [Paracoccus sp. (in: a-proteobacteria)]
MHHFVMSGLAPYAMPIPYDEYDDLIRRDGGELATITIAGTQSAQGSVLRRYWDGRVTIDAGGRQLTGYPVGATPAVKTGGWLHRLLDRA